MAGFKSSCIYVNSDRFLLHYLMVECEPASTKPINIILNFMIIWLDIQHISPIDNHVVVDLFAKNNFSLVDRQQQDACEENPSISDCKPSSF